VVVLIHKTPKLNQDAKYHQDELSSLGVHAQQRITIAPDKLQKHAETKDNRPSQEFRLAVFVLLAASSDQALAGDLPESSSMVLVH